MKRYANDKYYYWRDELTNPKAISKKDSEDEDRNKLSWLLPLSN